jgi:outer membrane protein assembly factor BamB
VLFVPAGSSLLAFALDGCRKRRCASLWSTDLGALVTGGPAVSVGQVYVGTADGRLVAFGLPR